MARLDKMNMEQLNALEVELQNAKASRVGAEREKAKAHLVAEAKKLGFTIEELFGGRKGGKRGPVAVKFRNPKNTEETWTGRGRRPRWLEAALKKRGVKIEDFAV